VAVASTNAFGDATAALDRVSDFHLFEAASVALLEGRWTDVFGDAGLQVGVLTLLLGTVVLLLERLTGIGGAFWFAGVAYLGITFGVVWVVRVLYRREDRASPPALELGLGLLVNIAGVPMLAIVSGHLSEAVIPLVWVLAAREARDGHPMQAGTWIAVASGFKTWGLLALPVALLARGRERLTICAVAGVGAVVLYLPFLWIGGVNFLQHEWSVRRWSLVATFLEEGSAFTWEMRVAQALLMTAVGVAIALALRTRSSAIWAVPLALVIARLATDPLAFGYYWLAAEVLVVVAVAASLPDASRPVQIGSVIALIVALFAKFVAAPTGVRLGIFSAFLALSVTSWPPTRDEHEIDEPSLSGDVQSDRVAQTSFKSAL